MTRKSPIRHKVKRHTRKNRSVRPYSRGKGNKSTNRITIKKRVSVQHVVPGASLREGHLPSAWRGYKHGMFRKAYEKCSNIEGRLEQHKCEISVRMAYHSWENGRLAKAIDKMHIALTKFDRDELDDFKKRYPRVIELVNELAVIEELAII